MKSQNMLLRPNVLQPLFLVLTLATIVYLAHLHNSSSSQPLVTEALPAAPAPLPVVPASVSATTSLDEKLAHYVQLQEAAQPLRVRPIPPMFNRAQIFEFLEAEGNFHVGAELGVQSGLFSAHALANWPSCTKYYLVDVWKQQDNYKDLANVGNDAQEGLYQQTLTRVEPWKNKIEVLRMFTSEAAPKIPDGSLDFVYVDARHDYCGVFEDLVVYWPKLRRGGILAGHDYMTAPEVAGQDWSVCHDGTKEPSAVVGAVRKFADALGLQIVVVYNEYPFPSWLIRKP